MQKIMILMAFFVWGASFGYANVSTEQLFTEITLDASTKEAQQTSPVTGFVKDASSGEALIGVTVLLKGTQNGSTTNENGKFSVNVSNRSTAILVFSYLGYESKEVKVNNLSTLDIELSPSSSSLEEVVVTALGQRRELKSLGYAMSSLKGNDLVKAGNVVNPLTSLYGKAAGVGVVQGAAGPTGGINIKIRGSARLNADSKTRPLFVVDGVPIHDSESTMAQRNYDSWTSFDYGSGINDINAEDIESMEILKGAKASVLYGSEGANGVVLITTKKGDKAKGLGVTLSYQATYEEPVTYIKFQNDYGSGINEYSLDDNKNVIVNSAYNFGPKFDGRSITYWDGSTRPYQAYDDNYSSIFTPGNSNNLQVALAGGNEKGNMRFAYTNYDYNGNMTNFWQKKNTFSFTGKMNASKLTTFEISTNLYDVQTHNRNPNMGSLTSGGINRDYDYQTMEKMYLTDDGYKRDLQAYSVPAFQTNLAEILWHQNQNSNTDDKLHFIGSIRGTFKFHPSLYLSTFAGLDYTRIKYITEDKVTAVKPTTKGGQYEFRNEEFNVQNFEATLNFDQKFMEENLRLFAFVGGSYRSRTDYYIYTSTFGDMAYPDWYSLNNAPNWPSSGDRGKVLGQSRGGGDPNGSDYGKYGSDLLYGVFGNATLSWKEKYYLEFNARNDWASTLPPQNNSYFYPGASVNWNFNEDFQIPELQFGKLRFSYAYAGAPASRYFAINSYGVTTIPGAGGAQTVTPPSALFSGVLKPERKREFEVGFDTKWFKQDRVDVDFSFYTNQVFDQIMQVPLSGTTGYSKIKINAGDVKNWGYELFLKGTPVITKDLRWDVTFTSANQFSKVQSLYQGISRYIMSSNNGWQVVADEGKRMGELQTYDYKKTTDGQRIVSDNGLYSLDYNKGFVNTGNVYPSFVGGFSTDLNYKNFNFHLGFDYSFGSSIVSMTNYYLAGYGLSKETLSGRDEASGGLAYYKATVGGKEINVPWKQGQTVPNGGKVYHDGIILPGVKLNEKGDYVKNEQIVPVQQYWQTFVHDMQGDLQPDYIYKNNYVKLREVALSYSVPKKTVEKLKLQSLTLSLTARNLLFLYKSIPNVDPESALGTNSFQEYSALPSLRSWGVGVNVSF